MQLYDIGEASRNVRETSARSDKIRQLAACLRRIEPDEIETAVALLSGEPRQGRIGLGPATLHSAMPPDAAPAPELTLAEVDVALSRIAQTRAPARRPVERVWSTPSLPVPQRTNRIFYSVRCWASSARVPSKG